MVQVADVELTFQDIVGQRMDSPEIRKLYYSLLADQIPVYKITDIINPRRACAARVTVLGLSFCLSVTTFSAATRNKMANKRY